MVQSDPTHVLCKYVVNITIVLVNLIGQGQVVDSKSHMVDTTMSPQTPGVENLKLAAHNPESHLQSCSPLTSAPDDLPKSDVTVDVKIRKGGAGLVFL